METPKTKMQMVREYLAEHPNAKNKEVAEAVGCSISNVRLARNTESYERAKVRQKKYDHQKWIRNREKIIEQTRQYRAAHREEINEKKRRYYAATKRRVELQPWSAARRAARRGVQPCVSTIEPTPVTIEPTAKVRPIPDEARRFVREQEHLLKLMASAATPAMYQELARQYSVLQMKIDYAATMANAADRHDAANHQCGVPMMFKVANGNGFSHH